MSQLIPAAPINHALGPVKSDWDGVAVWLEHLRLRPLSPATISSYRYELSKLQWYCENIIAPSPSHWSIQDAMQFIAWLQNEVHKHLSPRNAKQGDQSWTPFKTVPSKSSLAVTVRVVNGLFNFWVETGYIARNPMKGLGRDNRKKKRTIRSVPPEFVEAVIKHMEIEAGTDSRKFLEMTRNRFIILLLERTGLRANEVVQSDMDDIEAVVDPKTNVVYWRLNVRFAKGGKESFVLLDEVVMDALKIYREAFGYRQMTLGKESGVALILSLKTKPFETSHGTRRYSTQTLREYRSWGAIRRRQSLWDIVKKSFEGAANAMREQGYTEQADSLLNASTHWLRHSFGTRLVQQGHDLRLVAQLMRHENIRNTMLYTEQDFLDIARQMGSK